MGAECCLLPALRDAPIGGGDPWWYGQPQDYTAFDDPRLAAQLEGESFYFSVNGVPVFAKVCVPLRVCTRSCAADPRSCS
jgi:hypothetical protein